MIRRLACITFLLTATVAGADDACRRAIRGADPIITSSSIDSAAYGDFDEDGRPDVALMVFSDFRIIALNRGSVFQPMPLETASGSSTLPIAAAADVNGDGHLDLLYHGSVGIDVARGRGDGTFQPLLVTRLINIADSWRAVDFNHDGLLDFVDSWGTVGFTFVQSLKDGTFGEVAHVDLPGGFLHRVGMVAGDFDGDGKVDVARLATEVETSRLIQTFGWNDGTSHFTQTETHEDIPYRVKPLDLDGDGAEELVAIDQGSLVIVRAAGRHVTVDRIPVAPGSASLALENALMLDVDRDGIRDLVFRSGSAVGVLPGVSANGFGQARYFELPGSGGLAPVDLDGDGILDLAALRGSEGLAVLYGATLAMGHPNANRVYSIGLTPASAELADVDGDGKRDLVMTAASDSGSLFAAFQGAVFFDEGGGTFQRAAKSFRISSPLDRGLTGDFDYDGRSDLAMTPFSKTTAKPRIAFGSVDGFDPATLEIDADVVVGRVFLGAASPPGLIALKDDDVQLVTLSAGRVPATTTVYHRPPNARIQVVRSATDAPAQIAVILEKSINLVTRGEQGWSEKTLLEQSSFLSDVANITSADMDHDGRADYLVCEAFCRIFFGKSDGSYRAQQFFTVGSFVGSATPADVDGDGLEDIVVTASGNLGKPGRVQFLRNVGGQFEPYATALSGAPGGTVVVDDVDGDALPDVIRVSFDGAEVMKNICATPRVRVVALPAYPREGDRVTLLVHALSTDGFSIGPITISENGALLAQKQPLLAFDLATTTWTSAPLPPGTHTFRVEYHDQYAGSSQVSIDVRTVTPVPRRRAARH